MNRLIYGDNLGALRGMPSESIDLVYLDPPFNSNRDYSVIFSARDGSQSKAQIRAFEDTWTWGVEAEQQYDELMMSGSSSHIANAIEGLRRVLGPSDAMAYLVMMTPRLIEIQRLLKPTGSVYLHCDPTASHYLKVVMDAVFGPRNFRNEVIWQRTAAKGDAKKKLGTTHDVILNYVKADGAYFVAPRREPDEEYLARFSQDDGDGRGRYHLAPLDSPSPRPNLTYEYKGFQPPAKGWRVSREVMEQLDAEGRLAFPRSPEGRIRRKLFLNDQDGPTVGDVWTDIPPLQATSAERLGYPTQKPLALLTRIIESGCPPDGVVLDPFCGCGTTVDAAEMLGRQWVGIDITFLAVDLIEKRLRDRYGERLRPLEVSGVPTDVAGAAALFAANPLDFERWAVSLVGGQPNDKQVGDSGIDGVVRFRSSPSEVGRVVVSVKGGQSINPAMVRDLVGTVQNSGGQMGVLVLMKDPTPGMKKAAAEAGNFVWEYNSAKFPLIQLLTVRELLEGTMPKMPPPYLPYVKADPRIDPVEHLALPI